MQPIQKTLLRPVPVAEELRQMPDPFVFETRIRFIDTDASGRIHYSCLFRYFESAEIEFFRTLGFRTFAPDLSFPRVHVECDYRLALLYDDLIAIEVRITKLGRTSVRLEFRAIKDGETAAAGVVVMVCMDRKTQQAVAIPEDTRTALARALQEKS